MKKSILLFTTLLFALLGSSCRQTTSGADGNSNTSNNQTETITAGWYAYTTNASSSNSQTTYLYINAGGSVERAGSISNEYTGTQFSLIQEQLSYSICKKNADGSTITFKTSDAPSWAEGAGGQTSACPYTEYLDCATDTSYSAFHECLFKSITWSINKDIQLWSAKEYSYYSSLSNCGVIDKNNKFIRGSDLKVGDWTFITMIDTDSVAYKVEVHFVSDTNENSDLNLQDGYEWWCFEKAYLGGLNAYVLYNASGKATRAGSEENENSTNTNYYMDIDKETAVTSFTGIKYKVTSSKKLPAWCLN